MNQNIKVGVVGCAGYVGKAMVRFFSNKYEVCGVDASFEEEFLERAWENLNNTATLGVVCVPTESREDGSCDTTIVEEVVDKLETPLILIKSTVAPGTVDRLREKTGKRIVFSPEYCGESDYNPGHNFLNVVANEPFYIFGGEPEDRRAVLEIVQRIGGPTKKYMQCTAKEAETIKYFENTFLGVKVVLVYEFHQICKALGVDWNTVREGWLLDPRINPSHTSVFADNMYPYGGKCLPKDIKALAAAAREAGYEPGFIRDTILNNEVLGEKRGTNY